MASLRVCVTQPILWKQQLSAPCSESIATKTSAHLASPKRKTLTARLPRVRSESSAQAAVVKRRRADCASDLHASSALIYRRNVPNQPLRGLPVPTPPLGRRTVQRRGVGGVGVGDGGEEGSAGDELGELAGDALEEAKELLTGSDVTEEGSEDGVDDSGKGLEDGQVGREPRHMVMDRPPPRG